MRQMFSVALIVSTVAAILGVGLQSGAVLPARADEDAVVEECGRRLEAAIPLVTIPASQLALDRVKLGQQPLQRMVIIPLKMPRGDIRAIRWTENDPTVALDFIRLLQAGKIGAVTVMPLLQNPAKVYVLRGVSKEAMKACDTE